MMGMLGGNVTVVAAARVGYTSCPCMKVCWHDFPAARTRVRFDSLLCAGWSLGSSCDHEAARSGSGNFPHMIALGADVMHFASVAMFEVTQLLSSLHAAFIFFAVVVGVRRRRC